MTPAGVPLFHAANLAVEGDRDLSVLAVGHDFLVEVDAVGEADVVGDRGADRLIVRDDLPRDRGIVFEEAGGGLHLTLAETTQANSGSTMR